MGSHIKVDRAIHFVSVSFLDERLGHGDLFGYMATGARAIAVVAGDERDDEGDDHDGRDRADDDQGAA
jgi:hypothetical protein